ncbi:MAG TPA: hypothetical protein VF970_13795 [Gemmatimonadales bacterium]
MKPTSRVLVAAGAALLGACGGTTEITVENLEGTWDATAYVFTNKANSSQTADIVALFGATLTLMVQADGTTTSTFNNGQGSSSSNSGAFTAAGTALTLAGVTYQAALDGDRLTLTFDTGEYDFDNNGSADPATVRVSLERR